MVMGFAALYPSYKPRLDSLRRHSGAMRSIELWCAIAAPEKLEIPGSPL
jgi:hypothetical protein